MLKTRSRQNQINKLPVEKPIIVGFFYAFWHNLERAGSYFLYRNAKIALFALKSPIRAFRGMVGRLLQNNAFFKGKTALKHSFKSYPSITKPPYQYWISKQSIIIMLISFLSSCEPMPAFAQNFASYYTVKSCLKESGQFTMANGRRLEDDKFTAASWDYEFGTMLKVTNIANGKTVIVEVTDRGPAKKLYAKGRVLDLSLASFMAIADCKQGIIPIKIERLK